MSTDPYKLLHLTSRIPLRIAEQQVNKYLVRVENCRGIEKNGCAVVVPPLPVNAEVSVTAHLVSDTVPPKYFSSKKRLPDFSPETLAKYIFIKNPPLITEGATSVCLQIKILFDKVKIPKTAKFFLKIQVGPSRFVTNAFSVVSHQNQITDKTLVRWPRKVPSDEDSKSPVKRSFIDATGLIGSLSKELKQLETQKEKMSESMTVTDQKIKKCKMELQSACDTLKLRLE